MEAKKQTTLKGSFSLFGKGLHTGLNLTVTFNPAPENTGYKIQRIDIEGQPIIDAVAENVVDTQRGTVLAKGDVRVSTVEHGMAALYASGIDNCIIQVNGPEFPILDGSAAMYVEKIKEIGLVEQNATKDYYIIRHKIEVKDEDTGSVITILPDDQLTPSLSTVSLLPWRICRLSTQRLLQQEHSCLYATSFLCWRQTLSKVATLTMPLLSMNVK